MHIFCSKAYILFCGIILSISAASVLSAQTNSPYSRFGIGDIQDQSNIVNRGMGGAAVADFSPFQINNINPATYPYIKIATLQLGLNAERNNMVTKDSSANTGGFNIAYLNIGFPLGKRGGCSFGLMPESRTNYRAFKQSVSFSNIITQSAFTGNGGLQKFYAGLGYAYKEFSIGANANFLFGNYSHQSLNQFYDTTNIYSAEYGEFISANGVSVSIGALYNHTLKKSKANLGIGLTYKTNAAINATRNQVNRTFLVDGVLVDTISSKFNEKGKIVMPAEVALGIMYNNKDKIKIALDARTFLWDNYKAFGEKDSFKNSFMIHAGAAYRPDFFDRSNFAKRIEYRIGAFAGTDAIAMKGQQLNNFGGTLGIGVPLKRTSSNYGTLNMGLQIGSRGTTDNDLLLQNYTRFSIGVSVGEVWFRKMKYD
jgi:long-subunit fatty acid transport protein